MSSLAGAPRPSRRTDSTRRDYPDPGGAVTHERPVLTRSLPPPHGPCRDNPGVGISRISPISDLCDNLSSHDSKSTRAWLEGHPRIRHAFIPKGACWLNLQEGWWRIFRRQALAGQSFADPDEIAHATRVATAQLNARARPWIWGRPQPKPRSYRRRFVYTF